MKEMSLFVLEETGEKFVMEGKTRQQLFVDNLDFQQLVKLMTKLINFIMIDKFCCTMGAQVKEWFAAHFECSSNIQQNTHYELRDTISSLQCTSNETQLSQCNFSTQPSSWCFELFVRCQLNRDSTFVT